MVLELKDFADLSVSGMDITCYIVGMVIAAVIGYICIKTMLVIVRNRKFRIFAIYCLISDCSQSADFSIHYMRYFLEVIFWQQGKERVPLAEKLLAEKRIQDVRRKICSRRALQRK